MSLLISQIVEVILSKCGQNHLTLYVTKYEVITDSFQGPFFYQYYLRSELPAMMINGS